MPAARQRAQLLLLVARQPPPAGGLCHRAGGRGGGASCRQRGHQQVGCGTACCCVPARAPTQPPLVVLPCSTFLHPAGSSRMLQARLPQPAPGAGEHTTEQAPSPSGQAPPFALLGPALPLPSTADPFSEEAAELPVTCASYTSHDTFVLWLGGPAAGQVRHAASLACTARAGSKCRFLFLTRPPP